MCPMAAEAEATLWEEPGVFMVDWRNRATVIGEAGRGTAGGILEEQNLVNLDQILE